MFRGVRSRPIRFLLRAVAFAIVFSLVWFGVIRVTAPMRAVRIVASELPSLHADRILTHDPTPRLRIAAFNIAHGRGLSEANYNGESYATRLDRLHAIGDRLRGLNVDAVVLNEVDFGSHWSGGMNQARIIAERAGFDYIAEQTSMDLGFPFWRLRYGNAVLSRHPITHAERVDMPALKGWETALSGYKRAVLCTIKPDDSLPAFRLLGVHLEHRDEATRIASARVIEGLVQTAGDPMIVAGDFNSSPVGYPVIEPVEGQTALGLLLDGGQLSANADITAAPEFFTYRADRPDRVIDWVLAPRGMAVLNSSIVTTDLSDHCIVVSEIVEYPVDF